MNKTKGVSPTMVLMLCNNFQMRSEFISNFINLFRDESHGHRAYLESTLLINSFISSGIELEYVKSVAIQSENTDVYLALVRSIYLSFQWHTDKNISPTSASLLAYNVSLSSVASNNTLAVRSFQTFWMMAGNWIAVLQSNLITLNFTKKTISHSHT